MNAREIRFVRLGFAVALFALTACANRLDAPREFVVFFENDRAEVTEEAQQILRQVAGDVREHDPSKIVVSGRADGGTAHDAALADQRASTVIRALIDQGVLAGRIEKQSDAPQPGRSGVAAHQVVIRLLP